MPLPSHASSTMGDDTCNNHDENITMYEPLHSTRSFVPSCIMFSFNTPHVKLNQGLLNMLSNFIKYPHVRAFEEVVSSLYAQNVIKTTKLHFSFFPKENARSWLYTLKPRSIGNWREMAQEFFKKNFPPQKV